MSLKAKLYIAAITTCGVACIVHAFALWNPQDVTRFLCYMALAIPASGLKVQLPGVTGTMSMLFIFLLAGIVELDLAKTILIAVVCVLVQSYWRARVRPRPTQIVFNVGSMSMAITAAYYAYRLPLLLFEQVHTPFRLLAAASVFFFVNTFPVAVVIALTEQKSLRRVWRDCYSWSFPYHLLGAAIVGVFTYANRMLDWQAWLLILPVVYVTYRSYHLYLDRLNHERSQAEEQRRHAEEQRQHAAQVAALHSQAMSALASAVSANARLDAVIQASPLAVLSIDPGGMVTSWNTTAEIMLGWSSEETIARPLKLHAEGPEQGNDTSLDGILHEEPLAGMEIKLRRKNGSSFDAAIWTAPLKEREESVSGVLVTVADVSERRRLQEQLRLSQKMEAIGRLAGGIAHDFNNLLTVINGYSTMLSASLKQDAYACAQAEEILSAGNRAAELVSRLLTFSRRQVVKPKPIAINELIQNLGRLLGRLIGEHIDFRTVLDPQAGWILADPNQMEAVLMNLVTNARDAMPNGGILTIESARVEIQADARSPVPDVPPGSYVRLIVRDTGHGMDAETQQHLFEPFFTTKERGKGTGLGLSSVYGGVQQNRGHITVASEVGKGTAFSIYLPFFEPSGPNESGTEHPAQASPGTETILLVEDEIPVRRMLREALSRTGYRVWEAGNGAEALQQWGSQIHKIQLLVTDIVMPVMSGLQLANELRHRSPKLKVLFMSGHAEEMINNQGVLNSAQEFLPKPFLPDALVCKVREVLDYVNVESDPVPDTKPATYSGNEGTR
jgi:PAS domain S-box-containing protein